MPTRGPTTGPTNQTEPTRATGPAGHAAAPPARTGVAPNAPNRGDAGPTAPAAPTAARQADGEPTLRDRIVDAARFLGDGQMPWAAIGGTIAFPLTLAVGSIMTALIDTPPMRVLAVVPAVFLLAIVGVVCRQTMLSALRGVDEADDLPPPREFARQAVRLMPHAAALAAAFLGPGTLALGFSWSVAFVLLAAGLAVLPMAGALLVVTGNWRALSPKILIAAIRCGGQPYVHTALASLLLAVPAVIATMLTTGLPGYVSITAIGPLSVVPALMAARMMGLVLEQQRAAFEGVLPLPAATAAPLPKAHAPRAPQPAAKPPAAHPPAQHPAPQQPDARKH